MRRREFMTLLGGMASNGVASRISASNRRRAAHWRAHAAGRGRSGRAGPARGIPGGLRQLGWTDGRNISIEIRWPVGDADRSRSAEELVALAPDVILASASASVAALQRITRSVPIVFANVTDPVGAGSSPASRGRAATPPDLSRSNTA